MPDREKFMEMIEDVVKLAKMNDRQVTKEFLEEYFKELGLQQKQLASVCEYLMQENIKVTGYEKSVQKTDSQKSYEYTKKAQESEHLELYLDELRRKGIQNKISREIHRRAFGGDAQAKTLLIEQKLARVIEIAQQYVNQGLAKSDLIQEGNLGLLLAVEHLPESMEEAERYIDAEIEKSILEALDIYKDEKRDNLGLMRKAETLKKEMERLSEELGDQITTDDVAKFTGMDLEEIRNIIGMTGE